MTVMQQIGGVLVSLSVALMSGTAFAQKFPEKPVKIIVPFAPGGGADMLARTLTAGLTETWGQPVVVENRAGASGNIGAEAVARSEPDGHTLLLTSSAFVINLEVGLSPTEFRKKITDDVEMYKNIIQKSGLKAG